MDPAQYKELGEALLRSASINAKLISWGFGEINTSVARKIFFEIQGITHAEANKFGRHLSVFLSRVDYSCPVVKKDKIQVHPAIHRYEIMDKNVYSILLKIFKNSFDPLENIRNHRRELRFAELQNRKKLTRHRSVKNVMSFFAKKHTNKEEFNTKAQQGKA